MNNCTTTKIEEVFALPSIASSFALSLANLGKGMLDDHPFTQLSSSLRRLLTLAQLDE